MKHSLMELASDVNNIKNLLSTDEISDIEFSEDYPTSTKKNNYTSQNRLSSLDQNNYTSQNQLGALNQNNDNLDYLDDFTSSQYRLNASNQNESKINYRDANLRTHEINSQNEPKTNSHSADFRDREISNQNINRSDLTNSYNSNIQKNNPFRTKFQNQNNAFQRHSLKKIDPKNNIPPQINSKNNIRSRINDGYEERLRQFQNPNVQNNNIVNSRSSNTQQNNRNPNSYDAQQNNKIIGRHDPNFYSTRQNNRNPNSYDPQQNSKIIDSMQLNLDDKLKTRRDAQQNDDNSHIYGGSVQLDSDDKLENHYDIRSQINDGHEERSRRFQNPNVHDVQNNNLVGNHSSNTQQNNSTINNRNPNMYGTQQNNRNPNIYDAQQNSKIIGRRDPNFYSTRQNNRNPLIYGGDTQFDLNDQQQTDLDDNMNEGYKIENHYDGNNVNTFENYNGGKNKSDNHTSSKFKPNSSDPYEKDLYNIFKKAREYRERVINVQSKMDGGKKRYNNENEPKKKKPLNKTMALMLEMSKIMKQSISTEGVQYKHLMQISKMILDEAKRREKTTEVNEKVSQLALQLARHPDKFVAQFKENTKSK